MSFLRLPAVIGLSALSAAWLPSQAAAFTLEDYFEGRTYAVGKFTAINGTSRSFDVDLTGDWDGTTLRLREDFVYDDGERDTKTWVFTKTGPATYTGTREDVVGQTTVRLSGNNANFSYRVDLAPGDDVNIVRFFDELTLEDDDTVRNTALVTKFGLPVARVTVNFARTREAAAALRP